jgi:hypothetical protein
MSKTVRYGKSFVVFDAPTFGASVGACRLGALLRLCFNLLYNPL